MLVAVAAIISALVPWYSSKLQNTSLKQAERGFQVDALHTAEKAVSLNPTSVNALFVLAGAQDRLGRQDQARKTLLKATELQPLNYAVWEQLAVYERDHWHMTEEAKEHFKKAVQLNPQDMNLRKEAGIPEGENDSAQL